MAKFTAYIDEAGDEGFGKLRTGGVGGQSRWLIIGCILVGEETDRRLPRIKENILARFPAKKTRDLHFCELKHEQKVVACQEVARAGVGVAMTLSHKVTIPGSRFEETFKAKGRLYNYLVRWLLERLISSCSSVDEAASLKLVFSRRAGTDYQAMRDYLHILQRGDEVIRPRRAADWNVLDIDGIEVENHSKRAGLQIADVVTSAFFAAVEPNLYGNYEYAYADCLRDLLLRDQRGAVLNHGLTGVPTTWCPRLDAQQRRFFESFR